jgi:alpha-beta hydrolase superfamily lysophospholipase
MSSLPCVATEDGTAGKRRIESGGYRRDHLRAFAQRVEVDAKEVRIMGSKTELLRMLVAASSGGVLACPVLYRSGAPVRIKLRTRMSLI